MPTPASAAPQTLRYTRVRGIPAPSASVCNAGQQVPPSDSGAPLRVKPKDRPTVTHRVLDGHAPDPRPSDSRHSRDRAHSRRSSALTYVQINDEYKPNTGITLKITVGPRSAGSSSSCLLFGEYMNELTRLAHLSGDKDFYPGTAPSQSIIAPDSPVTMRKVRLIIRDLTVRGGTFHGQDALRALLGHLKHLLPSFRHLYIRFSGASSGDARVDERYADFQACFASLRYVTLGGRVDNVTARLTAFPLYALRGLCVHTEVSEGDVTWILAAAGRLKELIICKMVPDGAGGDAQRTERRAQDTCREPPNSSSHYLLPTQRCAGSLTPV
ncbi:hypothetical protein HDZ31DRAFT_59548 [Schizophyllum fasciatum]